MSRFQDADTTLARGISRGTRGGRAVSLSSARGITGRSAISPLRHAEMVLRPDAVRSALDAALVVFLACIAALYVLLIHGFPSFVFVVVAGRVLLGLWLRRHQWIALTRGELYVLEGAGDPHPAPRHDIAEIDVSRDGVARIEFLDASGAPIASAPRVYNDRQLRALAQSLGVRLVDHRVGG